MINISLPPIEVGPNSTWSWCIVSVLRLYVWWLVEVWWWRLLRPWGRGWPTRLPVTPAPTPEATPTPRKTSPATTHTWIPDTYGRLLHACSNGLHMKSTKTSLVLSEMKAIMSPPVCHWMESNFFCRGRWNCKLELSQKVMNTPCATWERGLIFYLDLEPTLVKHRHCTFSGKLFVNPTRGSEDKERT